MKPWLILHDHRRDYIADPLVSGLRKIALPAIIRRPTDNETLTIGCFDVIIITSDHKVLYDDYFSSKRTWKGKWPFSVCVDSSDLGRPRPPYRDFDLVFCREYEEAMKQIEHVLPLNIGLTEEDFAYYRSSSRPWKERSIDISFRGQGGSGRAEIVEEFNRLSQQYALRVDCKCESIPREQYAALLGNSKLVLSPPGGGWDCRRHYEAVAAGSFPLAAYHWFLNPNGWRSPEEAMKRAIELVSQSHDNAPYFPVRTDREMAHYVREAINSRLPSALQAS